MAFAAGPAAGSAPGMATTDTLTRPLDGTAVFPIGLGGMPLSVSGRPDKAQAIRTVHAALDAGVTLIDTADAYALDESEVGHNERLIAKALRGRREDVVVATKGGHVRPGGAWELDGSPAHLRSACEASLRALGTDRIDLYQYHRPDPAVPFAESVGALKELQDEGKVRWVGLSNVGVAQLEEALGIVDVVAVQNQLALDFTSPLAKGEVQACTERGIAFLPWSPLGGIGRAGGTAGVQAVRTAAEHHGVSPQQVVLAWLLSLGPTVIPIPGSRRPETITDSLAAATLRLDDQELAAITAAVSR
jgi:aryl-alcohol dehydrogenase-like predicted oxidoreductase